MRGVFDERELQPAEARHDTELTLSSTMLLLIFFGLVLLCGLCFGLGYATGHHSTVDTAVMQPAANPQAASPSEGDRPKPVAEQQEANNEPAPDQPADGQLSGALEASAQTSPNAPAAAPSNPVPQVKPAYPPAAN